MNITKRDSCTVEVFWDPPFTLQGVPILGYNINITNVITGEIFSTTTEYTSIQISLEYSINVTIAAVNGAGQGNISIIIIDLNKYEEGNKLSIIIWFYSLIIKCSKLILLKSSGKESNGVCVSGFM